jgi:hypothetical protein
MADVPADGLDENLLRASEETNGPDGRQAQPPRRRHPVESIDDDIELATHHDGRPSLGPLHKDLNVGFVNAPDSNSFAFRYSL